MVSNVVITRHAQGMLDNLVFYLLDEKKSTQAAKSLIQDARATRITLMEVANSLRYCDDPDLHRLGYKKIFFNKLKYLYVFQIIGETVYIEAVYHQLQDYENIFKDEVL